MQIMYKPNDIKKMLFTELVIAKNQDTNYKNVFEEEIYRRFRFCGFDDKFTKEMIEYEEAILETTKKEYDKYFYQIKYWIDIKDNENLFKDNIENYALYINGNMSNKAFTTSELISIYDEGDFINRYGKDVYHSHIKEVNMVTGNSKYNLLDEFRNRIGYILSREFNKEYDSKIDTYAARLYKNEAHILFINKYQYAKNDEKKWEPYTEEFYNYYK